MELLEENYPDRVEVVAEQYCDWDAQKALECMENWVQRFSGGGMNCVISAGAQMATGAVNAVVAAGYDMDDWTLHHHGLHCRRPLGPSTSGVWSI